MLCTGALLLALKLASLAALFVVGIIVLSSLERPYRALQNMNRNTVISITTGIADLVGDLSAMLSDVFCTFPVTSSAQFRISFHISSV